MNKKAKDDQKSASGINGELAGTSTRLRHEVGLSVDIAKRRRVIKNDKQPQTPVF